MEVAAAIDAMLALAAAPARQERVLAMRAAFEARTGAFSPGDAFFEARSAAFWDDALTRGAFGREIADELSPDARALVEPFARAHRGLFRVEPDAHAFLLVDEWSGAELVAEPSTPGLRDALERASGLVDARVVGAARIVVLPGALFHHADAVAPMRAVVAAARERDLATDEALDALLRMDHAFRTLSRVKPAFAYRKEAL
ncbi:MAG TPA: hypothetical protein VGH28_23605 [Polyangiaceae bacterium]|jgi:hypothetical protein